MPQNPQARKLPRDVFRMPAPMNIIGRSSSITNAFANSIIPIVEPSEDEVREVLEILGMAEEDVRCCYCGDKSTEWDHFRPLIVNKKPTGYISEIANLVPSCGKCNQSKGNKNWRTWIESKAPLSPATKGTRDLHLRIQRLEVFEKWRQPVVIRFEEILEEETWTAHGENEKAVLKAMRQAQVHADKIRSQVIKHLDG